ncbi:MAG: TIGR03564 family F420-dependent LLM class oxidoreductase [Acidimicrobiales bacterium]
MRVGLSGGASSASKMVEQAQRAEEDSFSSLWYASAVGGDPLVAMAMAGRATSSIELGTSVLQTYTAHPVLQANRAASVVDGMGRPGFTLGIGPSHQPPIEDAYGLSYDHPGRHTEEYVRVLTGLLRGEAVAFDGDDFRVHAAGPALAGRAPVPVLVAALAPRLLRVAGELTDGTILWMGNEQAVKGHVAPKLLAAASAAGRPAPRIVAGLPVAVHDDVDEARATAAAAFSVYGQLPNYRRLLDIGGAGGPEDAAIIGDEAAVTARIDALFAAGATDVWAAVFPVGADGAASRRRSRALLKELAAA